MLETIQRDGGDVRRSSSSWPRTRTRGFRLMGFGHRVYKNFDPRAKILKTACRRGARPSSAINDPLLDIAKSLEEVALQRRVLRRAQALPERRLLQRHHLPRDGHPDQHVHGHVRPRPPAGLDRALEGDDARTRRRASTGRARSTSARPSAASCRSPSASGYSRGSSRRWSRRRKRSSLRQARGQRRNLGRSQRWSLRLATESNARPAASANPPGKTGRKNPATPITTSSQPSTWSVTRTPSESGRRMRRRR